MFRKESWILRQSLKIKKEDKQARLVPAWKHGADELLTGGSNRNSDASAMICVWELSLGGTEGKKPKGDRICGYTFGVRETWDQILPVRPLSCCWIWARYITFLGFYIFLLLWSQSNWLSIQRVRTKVNHSRKALSIVPSMNLSGYLSVCDFKRQVKKNF